MKRPSGVTFNEEESDISSLIKNIKDGDDTPTSIRGSVPINPKKEDLLKFVGNLQLGIPTGFILLHDDFNRLISLFEKEGESSSSNVSNKGSGVANTVTAVATSISAISDLFKGDGSSKFLEDILGDPGLIERISSDEGIIDIIVKGTSGYLQSYYLNLINNNGYDYDFNSLIVTKHSGFDAGSLFKDIGDGIGSIFSSSVSTIATNLTSVDTLRELQNREGVRTIHEKGYSAYLKTYYANLTNANGYKISSESLNEGSFILQDDTNISSILKDVSDGIASVFSSNIAALSTSIITNLGNLDLEKDTDIEDTKKKGYIAYLKTYYANLTNANGYKISSESLNEGSFLLQEDTNISSVLKDVSDGLASVFSSSIDALSTSITTNLENLDLEKDIDIEDIRKKGYIAYIKTYYSNMLEPQGFSISIDNLNKGEFILERKGSLPSFIEDVAQGLGTIISTTVDTISNSINNSSSSEGLESDRDISYIRKSGYSAYLKAYYLSLLAPYGLELDISELNENNAFVIKEKEGLLSDILKGITDISSTLGNSIKNLFSNSISNIENLILDSSINEDTEVRNIRVEGYSTFVNKYFSALNDSFDSKKVSFSNKDYSQISSAISTSLMNTIKGITEKSTIEISDNTRTIVTSTYKDDNLLAKIDILNGLLLEISSKLTGIQEKETEVSPVVVAPSTSRGDLSIERLTQFN